MTNQKPKVMNQKPEDKLNFKRDIEGTLKALWAIRNEDQFYFMSYGEDLIKSLLRSNTKSNHDTIFAEMEQSIIDCLSKLQNGYGHRKWAISEQTNIPEDILTVLLKRLKDAGKIELMAIWSESTGRPDGSGYCISGNLN